MKFRQGKAPAILYRDGKKLWEFAAGILETDDPALIALLLERGAEGEGESGVRSVESGVRSEEPPVIPSEARNLQPTAGDASAAPQHDKPGEKPADKPSRKRTKTAP